jgi:uncharacterized protein YggE
MASASMRTADAAPTPINPGEFTVPVYVTTRWRLVPTGTAARACR